LLLILLLFFFSFFLADLAALVLQHMSIYPVCIDSRLSSQGEKMSSQGSNPLPIAVAVAIAIRVAVAVSIF